MIDLAQKMIFAARTRQRGSQFRVRERAAQRAQAAHGPKHDDRETAG